MTKQKKMSKETKKRKYSDGELIKYLWQFIPNHKKNFLIVCILMIINIAFTIANPLIFKNILELIDASNPNRDVGLILPGLVAYFLISIFNWFAIVFRRRFTFFLNTGIVRDIRIDSFNKMIENELQFYHNSESGVLISTLTNDVQEINDTGERFLIVIINLTRLAIVIGILLTYSIRLTLVSIGFLPISFFFFLALRRYRREAEKQWRKSFGDVNQSFSESMRSIAVCKTFAQEDENIKLFSKKNEKTYKAAIKRAFGIFIIGPFGDLFRHLLLVAILVVGMIELGKPDSTLNIASFYLFIMLLDYYFYPIINLVYSLNRFQAVLGILERIYDFCMKPGIHEQLTRGDDLDLVDGSLEFRHVNFSYTSEKEILRDISFHIEPGQRLALVGHTGSGKTTIASLIMRFYEIQSGSIIIDGKDIREYSLNSLRNQIGLVNQKVLLIKGTIRDNLLLANKKATEEELLAALDAVQAREFIDALPQGLDTVVSENGKNLSAGQRQMISFGRVLLGHPKMIILDEATSSVDLYTEAKIQDSTDLLLTGRTSIVIAHRLTTILKSDKIVVLNEGEIAQIGTHDDLVSIEGPYKEMYNLYFKTQSAKYLEQIKVSR
jgi:ATP-binding cassette subfamily B protein